MQQMLQQNRSNYAAEIDRSLKLADASMKNTSYFNGLIASHP
jgi:hypothetical protein